MLNACINADLCLRLRTFDSAFHVRGILKRGTEHFLLVGTVRAPIGAVHLGALSAKALGKSVHASVLLMPQEKVKPDADGYDGHNNDNFEH